MMQIGILGAGAVARAHARALASLKSAGLVAVHDIDAEAAGAFAGTFGATAVSSAEAVFEMSDAVVVATPNFTHYDLSLAALRSGCAVLCEKPLALSLHEAKAMVAAAHDLDRSALVGFNYRHLPVVTELRRLIRSGALGALCSIDLAFRKNSAYRRPTPTWRDGARSSGTSGALGDLGVHLLDLLAHVDGTRIVVEECQAHVTTCVTEKSGSPVEVDDHAEVFGRLSSGTFFGLTASKAAPERECGLSIRVVGSDAVFSFASTDGSVYRLSSGARTDEVALGPTLLADPAAEFHGWADSFRTQLDTWATHAVTEDATGSLATFDDGLVAQEALEHLLRQGAGRREAVHLG